MIRAAAPDFAFSHRRYISRIFKIEQFSSRNPPFLRHYQINPFYTMAGRAVKLGGVLAAAGAGYYLYTAGGDPKVAQKQAESRESPSVCEPSH